MIVSKRSAREWFQVAERCYLENHQGCAWCGGSYRVYQLHQENQQVFYCHGCDFRVAHDPSTGQYFSIPGEKVGQRAKLTMLEI